jgi:hypothetical protein
MVPWGCICHVLLLFATTVSVLWYMHLYWWDKISCRGIVSLPDLCWYFHRVFLLKESVYTNVFCNKCTGWFFIHWNISFCHKIKALVTNIIFFCIWSVYTRETSALPFLSHYLHGKMGKVHHLWFSFWSHTPKLDKVS